MGKPYNRYVVLRDASKLPTPYLIMVDRNGAGRNPYDEIVGRLGSPKEMHELYMEIEQDVRGYVPVPWRSEVNREWRMLWCRLERLRDVRVIDVVSGRHNPKLADISRMAVAAIRLGIREFDADYRGSTYSFRVIGMNPKDVSCLLLRLMERLAAPSTYGRLIANERERSVRDALRVLELYKMVGFKDGRYALKCDPETYVEYLQELHMRRLMYSERYTTNALIRHLHEAGLSYDEIARELMVSCGRVVYTLRHKAFKHRIVRDCVEKGYLEPEIAEYLELAAIQERDLSKRE